MNVEDDKEISEGRYDALRSEIIESEKTQEGLFRWKIILIGAITAAAFGISTEYIGGKNQAKNLPLVLICIPLLSLFTDLLYYHFKLRILAIGLFLREYGDKYELYIDELRKCVPNYFRLEMVAMPGSTIVFSSLVSWHYYDVGYDTRIFYFSVAILLCSVSAYLYYWWLRSRLYKNASQCVRTVKLLK